MMHRYEHVGTQEILVGDKTYVNGDKFLADEEEVAPFLETGAVVESELLPGDAEEIAAQAAKAAKTPGPGGPQEPSTTVIEPGAGAGPGTVIPGAAPINQPDPDKGRG
jgi:hypothetical protein